MDTFLQVLLKMLSPPNAHDLLSRSEVEGCNPSYRKGA